MPADTNAALARATDAVAIGQGASATLANAGALGAGATTTAASATAGDAALGVRVRRRMIWDGSWRSGAEVLVHLG